jgi:CRISPR-associated protein Cas1
MAATNTVPQTKSRLNPTSKHGVLTLSGFGTRVTMQSGHLAIEDGTASERRVLRLPRVGHGLKRLVIIGSDGVVSLAALRWLADQDAAFVMLERNGKVLCVTGPVRPSDARLRRVQCLAGHAGTAVEIARELIHKKLLAQERVARHKLLATNAADTISRYRSELAKADTPENIRLVESLAAGAYWAAWRTLPVNFPRKDETRIPDHWRVFGGRVSPLTGSPRVAVNPPNAILNYLYALLESESRLAAAALGLDPGLGVLHVDAPARDSLACDLMEPVRPQIDAFMLDWITHETLRREWFFEQQNGNCRLMQWLAIRLSETAPTWGRAVAPIAEWFAQSLWDCTSKSRHGKRILPTRLTQSRRSEGRGKRFHLDLQPAPHPSKICPGCGATTQLGRLCPKCGRELSGEKLIELAKIGRVAAQSPEAKRKHSDTQKRHEAAKRAWRSSPKPNWPNESVYIADIQPRLASVTINVIAFTLGVSESYAADIRAGRRRPHPRHWLHLAELVGVSRQYPSHILGIAGRPSAES